MGVRAQDGLAKRSVHHLDFDALVLINKEVVSLTGEEHQFNGEDARGMKSLLRDVEEAGAGEDLEETLLAKASLLMFGIASGQHFHEGNKRTALVAGIAFLQMNGRAVDIRDEGLVGVIDRAGVGRATLNDLTAKLRSLVKHV